MLYFTFYLFILYFIFFIFFFFLTTNLLYVTCSFFFFSLILCFITVALLVVHCFHGFVYYFWGGKHSPHSLSTMEYQISLFEKHYSSPGHSIYLHHSILMVITSKGWNIQLQNILNQFHEIWYVKGTVWERNFGEIGFNCCRDLQ